MEKLGRTISNKAIANYGLRLNRFSISVANSEEKERERESGRDLYASGWGKFAFRNGLRSGFERDVEIADYCWLIILLTLLKVGITFR